MADKGDPQDKVMEVADLKMKIKRAKEGPVSCAFGLTKEKAPLLLVDPKIKKAKKVRDKLKKDAGDAVVPPSIRFGTVVVTDEDPTTLTFTVNKPEVGGTILALVKLAKKVGFTGVVINTDGDLENESEEEESEAPPSPPAAPPEPGQGTVDWAARNRELTDLVKRMMPIIVADPSMKSVLGALAVTAQSAVKGMDDPGSLTAIEALRDAVENAPPPAPPAPPVAPTALSKSAQAWVATRRKISGDLDRLRDAIAAAYANDGLGDQLSSAFDSRVADLRQELEDDALSDALTAASTETDAQKREAQVAEAKKIIGEQSKFFSGGGLIDDLDGNPFLPLTIQKLTTMTLSTLEKAVH